MGKPKFIEDWFRGMVDHKIANEGVRAFAESFAEIFEIMYIIIDGTQRSKIFFKNNQAIIATYLK